jgi:hypothetical protein
LTRASLFKEEGIGKKEDGELGEGFSVLPSPFSKSSSNFFLVAKRLD